MAMTEGFDDPTTLRLVWPQWQGATRENVARLLPEVPLGDARLGYATGARVLQAVLPPHSGPTEIVPVAMAEPDEGSTGGVESRGAVSVAPFATLAAKHGDQLAVVWIDSHPDCDTPDTAYDGYHAMALSTIGLAGRHRRHQGRHPLSTSTPSTATRSHWASARNPADSPANRPDG